MTILGGLLLVLVALLVAVSARPPHPPRDARYLDRLRRMGW
ncbi:MAG: hypothetical protein ABSG25_09970 [Bryobacteraceae bacterium]